MCYGQEGSYNEIHREGEALIKAKAKAKEEEEEEDEEEEEEEEEEEDPSHLGWHCLEE